MNDTSPATSESTLSPVAGNTPSEMFPVLTSAQQTRVLAHGERRNVERGEIVIEPNEHATKVFIVVSGQLHILQVSNNREHVVAICNPGMFTGELNVLSGRRGLVRIRAAEKSELIEIEREASRLSRRRRFDCSIVCTPDTLSVNNAKDCGPRGVEENGC